MGALRAGTKARGKKRARRDFHRGEETYGFSPSNLISLEADFAQLYR